MRCEAEMRLDGVSILLAEDNPTNQMVAVQMLQGLGAKVAVANDGAEALEVLEDHTFDVALIDIEMPRVSGLDLIRHLRNDTGMHVGMTVIALTAYVMREHRAAIDDAGADGIIAKPILSIDQFGSEIVAIAERRHERLANEPPAPVVPTESVVDTEIFDELCSSFDTERLQILLGKVSNDIIDSCNKIHFAVENFDMKELRAGTHVLISVAGAVGAVRLQALAQCLNSAGHESDKPTIDRGGPELIAEASKVLAFLDGDRERVAT